VGAVAVAVVPGLVGNAVATFTASTTVSGNTISAGTVFPQTMSTAPYANANAAAGSGETDITPGLAAADGITYASHTWGTSFNSSRYIDVKYNSPLLTGRTTSGVQFNFSFESENPSGTSSLCVYFEIRRASTGAVLGTRGSSGSPFGCQNGTSFNSTATSLPEVTSSDIADDLMIRIYAKESTNYGIKIDLATVSGTADAAFTLQYWRIFDSANLGNVATFDALLVNDADGRFLTVSGWGTSFAGSQYVTWSFPTYVPSTAAITAFTFTHSFRAGGPGTACMYFEVYSGATLLATHGSTSSPYCTSSTTTFRTDTFPLPEVNTPAKAANLVIKMYGDHDSSTATDRVTQHDRATISFTYGFR